MKRRETLAQSKFLECPKCAAKFTISVAELRDFARDMKDTGQQIQKLIDSLPALASFEEEEKLVCIGSGLYPLRVH